MREFALGRWAALFLLALMMASCSSEPSKELQAMTRYTLQHGGLEREYFIFLPSSYDGHEELPVAIFMHGYGGTAHPSIDCLWPEGSHRWPGTPGFRGSNGYCVSELQAASMPEQLICIDPDPDARTWGSKLLFEFFNAHRGS